MSLSSRSWPLAAWLVLAGCSSLRDAGHFGGLKPPDAPRLLDRAEQEAADGELRRALDDVLEVQAIKGLDVPDRERSTELLERCGSGLLDQLEASGASSSAFEDLYDEEDLPPHLRARAGVLAADRLLAEDSRVKAYKLIKKIDDKLPGHSARIAAGDVLARAGLSLIHDDGHYGLFFSYRNRGVTALEYLVLQYPLDPHCPEAYAALAEHYEKKRNLDDAIDRDEDLILYHPLSPQAVVSEARLPHLRLERLERDDYDRRELLRARSELSHWLDHHAGHELEPWVRKVAQECDQRLTRSDLILARYYQRIGSPLGTRIHSERALRRAEDANLADLGAEARELLAHLPEEKAKPEGFGLPVSGTEEPQAPAREVGRP